MIFMTDPSVPLHIRRAAPADVSLLLGWQSEEPVEWTKPDQLSEELATRSYRPEWSWVAERDGRMVGRALWWGPEDADRPVTLDCLTVSSALAAAGDAGAVGAALIRAGLDALGSGAALEFKVDASPDWADDPAAVEAVRWRHAAARDGGFSRTTERLSFARTESEPRPPRSIRVRFRSASDEEFRGLFARVASGSLDAHTRDMVEREGIDALADDDLAFYLSLPGRREAWQVAHLPDGTAIGFIIPTRTAYDASISYLGVLPEWRGRGYVDDLLAEMVHVHYDNGAARVVGTTDAANTPMRAAFERAGFSVTRARIVHEQ
jgi:ribosomal protein S18 acetylase RimI-like enzyme